MMDISTVEKAIGREASKWKGECYAIACAMIKAGLIKGRAVHGTYYGPIHKDSMFYSKSISFARHGWIETPDGKIVDPTRWVFECVDPYLYTGSVNNEEYDEAGSKIRKEMSTPKPDYNPDSKQLTIPNDNSGHAVRLVLNVSDRDVISMEEAFWMANLCLDELNHQAKGVYEALGSWGLNAFIPADHQVKVFEMDMWEE